MDYTAKDYGRLLGMRGFSDQLLKNHFLLYQGYVANTNKLLGVMSKLVAEGKAESPEHAELVRRFGWEFNGMRLHELYFENMSRDAGRLIGGSGLGHRIEDNFGSLENWEKEFKTVGSARGIGWVVLYEDPENRRLFNCWIDEHDSGHLAGCAPIVVLDVFEHAFMIDYGLKRADYIAAFFRALDWRTAMRRDAAVSPEPAHA
jgi:Fe-Mn family superoxide dismutase